MRTSHNTIWSLEYQTCVSILFVGYILGQIPSNMFLTRTRPSRYMVSFPERHVCLQSTHLTLGIGPIHDALGHRERHDGTGVELYWTSFD